MQLKNQELKLIKNPKLKNIILLSPVVLHDYAKMPIDSNVISGEQKKIDIILSVVS